MAFRACSPYCMMNLHELVEAEQLVLGGEFLAVELAVEVLHARGIVAAGEGQAEGTETQRHGGQPESTSVSCSLFVLSSRPHQRFRRGTIDAVRVTVWAADSLVDVGAVGAGGDGQGDGRPQQLVVGAAGLLGRAGSAWART